MIAFTRCLKCGKFKKETLEIYASDVRDDNQDMECCECDEEKSFTQN